MKLGFVSSILGEYSFEQVVDFASKNGFECIEMACWPQCKAERRYAGVSHIDVINLTDEKLAYIQEYCQKRSVEISSLAFYPNVLDPDEDKKKANIEHLLAVIKASSKLNVNMITTFVGRNQHLSIEENINLFAETWPSIIKYAESLNVKVAIENCPMLFTIDQWPGGQNIATTPAIWKKLFSIIDSEYFGLNYDPSHFVWQMMDYIKPIYDFKDKIFHVHYKDVKIYQDKLNSVGIMSYPLEFMSPKLPGLGDVNWGKYVSALTDIGFDGYSCIEIEDKAYEGSYEKVRNSLVVTKKYLSQFVI